MKDNKKVQNNHYEMEELTELEELYKDSLYLQKPKYSKYRSLKYSFYYLNLIDHFDLKIQDIETDIETIKRILKNYKGSEVNVPEAILTVNDISNQLNVIKIGSDTEYIFYAEYLLNLSKKYKKMKNEETKKIYMNSSKDIINRRIEYNIKYEKIFIMFSDIIKELKNKLKFN